MSTFRSWRVLGSALALALMLCPAAVAGPCTTLPEDWDISVTVVDVVDHDVTYEFCVTSVGAHVCDVSHLDLVVEGGVASCLSVLAGDWVIGSEGAGQPCAAGEMVVKYDHGIAADGLEHCVQVTLGGDQSAGIACGSAVLKAGNACFYIEDVPVPTCGSGELDTTPCIEEEEPPPPCDEEAQGWTLTQGGWGNAKHYEALACDIIATCPAVAADIAAVAACYGYVGGDLGAWVNGDCGVGGGSDNGFIPSGFNPGENGGSQLIAALLSIDGVACYGLDRVGGDPVEAVGRDWIVLSTGQTVGEVLDAAMVTCGDGFADILGEINESWDEGFDIGTVSPCPR